VIQNCFSMRPGTLFGFKGQAFRVVSNDTLAERFTARALEAPQEVKTFRYPPSKEIAVRWIPFSN